MNMPPKTPPHTAPNSGRKATDPVRELSDIINRAQTLCEGLAPADVQMGERQFVNAAAGAFGLLAPALARAHDLLSAVEAINSEEENK